MLKVETRCNTFETKKFGEVFGHGCADFVIHCTLCKTKTVDYQDFLRHIKEVHFNGGLKKDVTTNIESNPFLEVIVKNEAEDESTEDNCEIENIEVQVFAAEGDDESSVPQWPSDESDEYSGSESLLEKAAKSGEDDVEEDLDEEEHQSKVKVRRVQRTDKEYICETCNKVYTKRCHLTAHLKRGHPLKIVKCGECAMDFQSRRQRHAHILKEHDGYKCTYCAKSFQREPYLARHLESHTKDVQRKYPCDYENCFKSFYTKAHLQYHKHRHSKAKIFICDICGYSCKEGNSLRCHYRSHSEERPHICPVCNKGFKSKYHLGRHAQIHDKGDPKKYSCDFENCKKSFGTMRQWEDHRNRHNKPKKYVCDICGYSSKFRQSLTVHQRTHTGEKSAPGVRRREKISKTESFADDQQW